MPCFNTKNVSIRLKKRNLEMAVAQNTPAIPHNFAKNIDKTRFTMAAHMGNQRVCLNKPIAVL